MKTVTALDLRQSLSKIIAILQRTGEPVLLQKGRKPAAVLISLEEFKKRFVDKEADERRRTLTAKIREMAEQTRKKSLASESAEELIRQLRDGVH